MHEVELLLRGPEHELGDGFAFILQYIGSSVTFSAAFIILIVVLFIRPRGILGSKVGRRDA